MSEVVTMEKLKEWKLLEPFQDDIDSINKATDGLTAEECLQLGTLLTCIANEKFAATVCNEMQEAVEGLSRLFESRR